MSIRDILRTLQAAYTLAIVILWFYCFSRRWLSWEQYCFYGLVGAPIPVYDPLLVIALHLGLPRRVPILPQRAAPSRGG